MIEKVPVMMAWLPTTAASMAITRTGILNFPGRISMGYFLFAENLPVIQIIQPSRRTSEGTYRVQTHKIQYGNHSH
jgi:hypothetical protein